MGQNGIWGGAQDRKVDRINERIKNWLWHNAKFT